MLRIEERSRSVVEKGRFGSTTRLCRFEWYQVRVSGAAGAQRDASVRSRVQNDTEARVVTPRLGLGVHIKVCCFRIADQLSDSMHRSVVM